MLQSVYVKCSDAYISYVLTVKVVRKAEERHRQSWNVDHIDCPPSPWPIPAGDIFHLTRFINRRSYRLPHNTPTILSRPCLGLHIRFYAQCFHGDSVFE